MATRKIRVTLSGTQVDSQGPIVDVDFNSTNQEADLDVTAVYETSTIVKEYTVDVDAGTYNLDIEFKNDEDTRDLYIENIEVANDGTTYEPFFPTSSNSTVNFDSFSWMYGYYWMDNPAYDSSLPGSDANWDVLINPDYDSSQPRTDDPKNGWTKGTHPGNNPKGQTKIYWTPIPVYISGTTTFNITFS